MSEGGQVKKIFPEVRMRSPCLSCNKEQMRSKHKTPSNMLNQHAACLEFLIEIVTSFASFSLRFIYFPPNFPERRSDIMHARPVHFEKEDNQTYEWERRLRKSVWHKHHVWGALLYLRTQFKVRINFHSSPHCCNQDSLISIQDLVA